MSKAKIWGPFWGEFGWEVAQWAPYVNAHFKPGDRVRCQPGHAQLYAVDGSIEQTYPRPTVRLGGKEFPMVPDMLQPWPADGSTPPAIYTSDGVPCIKAPIQPVPLRQDCGHDREWVVLHCRGIRKCDERNLPEMDWDRVVSGLNDMGIEPVIVGGPDDYLPQFDLKHDLRHGILCDTIHAMRRAKVVVGASSGPMHLAQAAGAPVIVWSGNDRKDKPRYESVWNHHGSPTTFLAPTWMPMPDTIIKSILNALQE